MNLPAGHLKCPQPEPLPAEEVLDAIDTGITSDPVEGGREVAHHNRIGVHRGEPVPVLIAPAPHQQTSSADTVEPTRHPSSVTNPGPPRIAIGSPTERTAARHADVVLGCRSIGVPLGEVTLPELLDTWDVAVALDPAARVAPDAVGLLVDKLGQLAARSGKPDGRARRLHLSTSSPERHFTPEVGETVTLETCDGDGDCL